MLFVFTGLIIAWAIVSYFFAGEKHMRWYYRQCGRDYKNYDAKRFKIAHSVSLFLVGLFGLLAVVFDHNGIFLLLMFLAVAMNYALILTWCKKKDSSPK